MSQCVVNDLYRYVCKYTLTGHFLKIIFSDLGILKLTRAVYIRVQFNLNHSLIFGLFAIKFWTFSNPSVFNTAPKIIS